MLRLSRLLPTCPLIESAFAVGRINFDHANAIVTALVQVPTEHRNAVEAALVQLAEEMPASELGDYIEELLVACGVEPSADEAAAKRLERRGLTISPTFDGLRSVSGLLSPEVGAVLELALSTLAVNAGAEDDRTFAQRRHDAVGELADHFLAHADTPAVNGERPRIMVTIGLDALEGRLLASWGSLPDGAKVSPATARRLACDSEVIPAVLGARGDVLDLAVASRSFSTAVRRAAWLEQNGRCAFPGCRRPPVDCHHIVWWTHGGPSTLGNAAWLCSFHHWLTHERGWQMWRRRDRGFNWRSPDGRFVGGIPPPRQPRAA